MLLVDSPSSSAYASMLRHMAAVKLVGADVERSYTNRGQSVPAVLAFMVPGTSQPDPHKGVFVCFEHLCRQCAGSISVMSSL